jgi:uncharacterized protein
MPTVLSDPQAIEDFVTGLAFLGTGGGGGRLEDGIELLVPLVKGGRPIVLISPDELPDDTWTCSLSSVGGRDPDAPPPAAELAVYGLTHEKHTLVERMTEAARELAGYKGVRLGALVSVELGSAATVGTILAGLELGLPTLDSDYAGRAKPEVGQSKAAIMGRSRAPMAFVDRWGNVSFVKSTVSEEMTDRLGRMLSVAAYGRGLGAAGHLMRIGEARPMFIRGSLLTAAALGQALREGRTSGEGLGPVQRVTGGRVLFEGVAGETEWHSNEPYMFRIFTYHIAGTGRFAGEAGRVWVKNEHHIVWRGDRLVVTSPDLIAILDALTHKPLSTRGDVTPGRRIVVFGMPALDPAWYTPEGIGMIGPRHFGFDFDYVPMDKLDERD